MRGFNFVSVIVLLPRIVNNSFVENEMNVTPDEAREEDQPKENNKRNISLPSASHKSPKPAEDQEAKGNGISALLSPEGRRMRNVLLLSVAYAANIGGTGVVTGTGPNMVLLEFVK